MRKILVSILIIISLFFAITPQKVSAQRMGEACGCPEGTKFNADHCIGINLNKKSDTSPSQNISCGVLITTLNPIGAIQNNVLFNNLCEKAMTGIAESIVSASVQSLSNDSVANKCTAFAALIESNLSVYASAADSSTGVIKDWCIATIRSYLDITFPTPTCDEGVCNHSGYCSKTEDEETAFNVCLPIKDADQYAECVKCVFGGGMLTALGCINTDPKDFVVDFLKIATGIAGGLALLLMIYGAFLVSISAGDPKKADEGKEIITGAIAGLLFIIFSVFLLKLIGVQILEIPGF